jgi:hypothetical protein
MIVSSDQNASNSIVYTPLDGGKSWKETLEVHVGNLAGDPVCPYGIGDVAYFVVLTTKDPAKLVILAAGTPAAAQERRLQNRYVSPSITFRKLARAAREASIVVDRMAPDERVPAQQNAA